tara:strand:+ start:2252 stop:3592 length:1341 start_codon:yes stop_codon:yes gene_type:complete
MKFLMTLFQIQDYGGIINHAEYLTKGLKELGHEVDFCMLVPKGAVSNRLPMRGRQDGYKSLEGGTGYKFHQARGWKGVPKIPYVSKQARESFKDRCSKYDAVLWHIPVPTLNKDNTEITAWLDLYDHGSKNIAIIHDGNLPKLYPHLISVSKYFHAAVCVHESAYNSAKYLDIPRKLILNPFKIHGDFGLNFDKRSGALAIQIFKAWKRVDTLVRAVPFIQEPVVVGGAGIEYRYMTSKDKCKPKYFDAQGNRIWEVALSNGMSYHGVVPNEEVLRLLGETKLQIDPSFSKKYSGYGAHFNRTTVEAMIKGAVPMATDLGMKDSQIFKSGRNYIEIPHTATPEEFGDIVNNSLTNKQQWETIRHNNLGVLNKFDMRNVAQEYADIVTQPTHFLEKGQPQQNIGLIADCNKNLQFFGLPKLSTLIEERMTAQHGATLANYNNNHRGG